MSGISRGTGGEAQCARPRREHAADGISPLPGVGQGPAVPGQFGLHWDNGKENGNYHIIIGVIWGYIYWGYILG